MTLKPSRAVVRLVPSLIVIDDSDDHSKADSAETQAANRFMRRLPRC